VVVAAPTVPPQETTGRANSNLKRPAESRRWRDILSITGYLQDAIDASRAEGYPVSDEAIAHLSPARFETINPYGAYTIDVASILNRGHPRPLRVP
jgi:hypothetical protein